jgi:hypothetical protein
VKLENVSSLLGSIRSRQKAEVVEVINHQPVLRDQLAPGYANFVAKNFHVKVAA